MLKDDDQALKNFELDIMEPMVIQSAQLVDEIENEVQLLKKKKGKLGIAEQAFPLYFSKSPLDTSKKIIEHIQALNDKKVKLFHKQQRVEFVQDKIIDNDIAILRSKQNELRETSKISYLYMDHIQKLTWKWNLQENEIAAWIRVYHKLLARKFHLLSIVGLDIVGLQRELGQLYISASNDTSPKSGLLQPSIIKCLYRASSAGVALEFVDGDTQNVNKDIIIHLLKKFEYVI